jgi:hypothetical protein
MTNKGSRGIISCTEPQDLTERSRGSDSRRPSSGAVNQPVMAGIHNDSEPKGWQRRPFWTGRLGDKTLDIMRGHVCTVQRQIWQTSPVWARKSDNWTIEAIWKAGIENVWIPCDSCRAHLSKSVTIWCVYLRVHIATTERGYFAPKPVSMSEDHKCPTIIFSWLPGSVLYQLTYLCEAPTVEGRDQRPSSCTRPTNHEATELELIRSRHEQSSLAKDPTIQSWGMYRSRSIV